MPDTPAASCVGREKHMGASFTHANTSRVRREQHMPAPLMMMWMRMNDDDEDKDEDEDGDDDDDDDDDGDDDDDDEDDQSTQHTYRVQNSHEGIPGRHISMYALIIVMVV